MFDTNCPAKPSVSALVVQEAAEIDKLDITENGEWGRSFFDGVKLAVPNASSTPGMAQPLSLLDELNSLDRAA